MKVKPMLGDWEIPHIENIQSMERRSFVELDIPGREGSLFQDMNSLPSSIVVSGSLYGDEKRNEFLEEVRGKFRSGEPLTFVGDIVTATSVQYVVIRDLSFEESSFHPDQINYSLVIKESPPPPPPAGLLADIDAGLLDQAAGFLDSVSGAMDLVDGLGSIPDISNPAPQLSDALNAVSSASEGLDAVLSPLQDIFGA